MLRHVILGLLRDGRPRHGYELMTEHRSRAGEQIGTGNFYRELGKLTSEGLVQTGVNPPDADARRIPYQATEKGLRLFDQWLTSSQTDIDELPERLLFIDRVPSDTRDRLFERWQETLWLRSKGLARAREDALLEPSADYSPLPALILRRMKHVTAELEFLKEFRVELEAACGALPINARPPAAAGQRRVEMRRDKGSTGK
jgi:DNA-binding PadR family transcriptional regulator